MFRSDLTMSDKFSNSSNLIEGEDWTIVCMKNRGKIVTVERVGYNNESIDIVENDMYCFPIEMFLKVNK